MKTFHKSLLGNIVVAQLCTLMALYTSPAAADMMQYFAVSAVVAYPSIPTTTVTTDFGYDGNGNLVARTDGNGATVYYSYDPLNRLATINYPGGVNPDVAFTYDVTGNRTVMTDATGTTRYYYDVFDRLTGIDYPGLNFVRYGYDEVGNITDLQYGNWMMVWIYGSYTYVQYDYDADNRISAVTNVFAGEVTSYQYDKAGNVTRRTLPNGAYTVYGYDADGRLLSVDHRTGAGVLIAKYEYTLNAIGNRTRVVETTPSGAKTTSYTYDALDRLDTVAYPDGRTVDYDYDSFGNRTRMTEVSGGTTTVTAYTYDSDSRLLYTTVDGVEDEQFYYDAVGNLIQRVGVRPGHTSQVEYVYDSENRLVRYYDGTSNVEYKYNGVGERVAKIVNGQRTNYLNDPNRDYVQAVMELDPYGIPTDVRVWGNEIINREDYSGGNPAYYLHDATNGSVRRLIDASSAVTNSYEFDAFGKPTSKIEAIANDYQFHGEVQEEETGLLFLRARYADMSIARFITRDPIFGSKESPDTLNPHIFLRGDPVNLRDPAGTEYQPSAGDKAKNIMFWLAFAAEQVECQRNRGNTRLVYYDELMGQPRSGWFPTGGAQHLLITREEVKYSQRELLRASEYRNTWWGRNAYNETETNLRYAQEAYTYAIGSSFLRGGNPGGVALNKTASVLLDINDIKGVTYDAATGQLVIFGTQNAALPAMDLDDLTVGAKAVQKAGAPIVSIDPPEVPCANNGCNDGECYRVRYGDLVWDETVGDYVMQDLSSKTHFGYVMFEADRVMKCLSLGYDNVHCKAFTSSVPGYKSMVQRWDESQTTGDSTARFWFQPSAITLVPSPDGKSMVFSEASVELLTESKYLSNGQAFGDQRAEEFAQHFTDHYDEFAAEFPIFEDLRQLAKIVGIMRWIKENNIPMDLSFIEQHTPAYCDDAPWTTPKTSVVSPSGTHVVEGGVTYCADLAFQGASSGPEAAILAARPDETTLSWTASEGGTDYRVAAVSVDRTPKDGAMSRADTDLSLRVNGAVPMTLTRHFDSFDVAPSIFGWGWTALPYQLNFKGSRSQFNLCAQQWEGYGEIWFVDRPGQGVYKYVPSGIYDKVADPLGIAGRFDPAQDILVYRYETEEVPGILFSDNKTNMTMRLANGILLDFHMDGRLDRSEDRNGNQIAYTYDGDGRLIGIGQTASGQSIGLTYDTANRVAQASASSGSTVAYAYDGAGNLASAHVDPTAGRLLQYEYDADHNLTKVKDSGNGWKESRTFDVYGRATAVSQPNVDTPFEQDYSLADRTTSVTGPESFTQGMAFDADYNLTNLTDARGNATAHEYNSYQDVVHETNALGRTTSLYYNGRGDQIATVVPSGRADVALVNMNGDPVYSFHVSPDAHFADNFDTDHYWASESLGGIYATDYTEYGYDAAGNLTSVTDALSRQRTFGYDSRGNRTLATDGRGFDTTSTYDSRSRLSRVQDEEGHAVDYVYDGRDNVTRITTAAGTVDMQYDARNRLTSRTDGNPAARHTTSYTYTSDDQLATVTDPAGIVTAYDYDARGNLIRITHNGVVRFEYDYDGLNRLVRTRYFGTVGSSSAKASVVPVSPVGAEALKGNIQITWQTLGNWTGNQNLELYYSTNGTDWTLIQTVNYADGSYTWDTEALGLKSDTVQIKFVRPGDASFRAPVTAPFRVVNASNYYVNDASRTNDVYCLAAGQTYNGTTVTGRTKNDPVNSIADILSHYEINPGDTIYVDTGSYFISADITFDAADSGTPTEPVTIRGTTHTAGSLITHTTPAASSGCIVAVGVDSLVIENLNLSGAANGIVLLNSYRCKVQHNECQYNGRAGAAGQAGTGAGIYVAGEGLNTIDGNKCHHNGANGGNAPSAGTNGGPGRGWGIVVSSSIANTVQNNECYNNGGRGGLAVSVANFPGYSEGAGIWIETSEPTVVSDGNHVVDNTSHDNDVTGANQTSVGASGGAAYSYGIALLETTNSNIERNKVYDNDAYGGASWASGAGEDGGWGLAFGIYGQGESTLVVTKNRSYDQFARGMWGGEDADDWMGVGWTAGIRLNGCSDSIVMNNLCYGNTATSYRTYGSESPGGAWSSGIELSESADCQIANNTVRDNGWGFYAGGGGQYPSLIAAQLYVGFTSAGSTIRNNICDVSQQLDYCIWVETTSQTGLTADYNDLYAHVSGWTGVWGTTGYATLALWRTNSGQDAHSLAGDPVFYNAAGGDYHVAYNSPAIDAGENLASVQSDGDGEARPADGPDADLVATHDIGYDEYVDSDADELSDWTEDITTHTDKNLWDTDGDGMHDGWEVRHNLDPKSAVGPNGAAGDPDHDGYSNIEEYPSFDPQSASIHPNMAPLITAATPRESTVFAVEGDSVDFSVTAEDWDGDVLSYSWLLNGVQQATANAWTMTTDDESSGDWTVRVEVSAAGDTTAREWAVHVGNRNRPPEIDPVSLPNQTKSIGETVTLTPVYSDPDNTNGVSNDDNVLTVAYSGWMTSASKVLVPGDGGIHQVTVTVTDNGTPPLSDSHMVTIAVTGEPDIRIEPDRLEFRALPNGSISKSAKGLGAPSPLAGIKPLDLSNPDADLGPVAPDEIVIRFRTDVAAALHAARFTQARTKQEWMTQLKSADVSGLPPQVLGLRPFVSGEAKALRVLEQAPDLRGDAKSLAAGAPLDPAKAASAAAAVAKATEDCDPVGLFHAKVPQGTDLRQLCLDLMKRKDVVYAHPSPLCAPEAAPNDPLFPRMWHLSQLHLEDAWGASGNTPADVRACVVDTGVRLSHSELQGRTIAPKDVYLGNGDAFADADPNNDDPDGHGTACAGLIAGLRGNNSLTAGIAPVYIIPVNCAIYFQGQWMIANYEDGIFWGVDQGADVINLSFGGYRSAPYSSEIDAASYAEAHGALVCAAAGNDNNEGLSNGVPKTADNHYPSAISTYLSVAAVDQDSYRVSKSRWWWGSNYGNAVDVCAPGQGYVGPDGDSVLSLYADDDNAYINYFGGTSAATAHATGVAALVKHVNPWLSVAELRNVLESTAADQVGDPAEDTAGWDPYHGHGLLDAAAAVALIAGGTSPQSFAIHNDGDTDLTITGIAEETGSAWFAATPESPLPITIPGHGSTTVSVSVDLTGLAPGQYTDRLVIASDDPDENPYADGVYVTLIYPSPEPQITGQPADCSAIVGGTAQFTVATGGQGPISYRWKKDGVALSDGDRISGAASQTLTISNVTHADAGSYSCEVSNPWAMVESDRTTLTVLNSPPKLATIGNQTMDEGATLAVAVSATDPDGDALTLSATGLPVFATFTDHVDGTAVLVLTPGYDAAGTYPGVTITATDAGTPPLHDSETLTITVNNVPHPPNPPVVTGTTPTNLRRPTWVWTTGGAGGSGLFRYQLDGEAGAWIETTGTSFTPAADLDEGPHTLYVQEQSTVGDWSGSGSCPIVIDVTPPSAPAVSGTTPTNDTTPTWSWTPGGGGNGTFRYDLDSSGTWTKTSATSYTPGTGLPEGTHRLVVQERDDVGNWSVDSFFDIFVDLTPPNPPAVSGTTPTNDTTPTWSWTPGGGGNGTFRYDLDSSGTWTETSATSYTPGAALPEGTHRLVVQERDDAGNWSVDSFFDIFIDLTPPSPPVVTGTTPTNDTTPTWSWTPGGGGNGTFRYDLDSSGTWTETSATSYTPGTGLPEGTHRLVVQERDDVGNWSVDSFFDIFIDVTPPNPPVVTGVTPTNDTTPTWSWTPGGGGNGTYRYKLDNSDLTTGATETTGTTYTPSSPLTAAAHTLYVQERDAAENWSLSGSFAITIDTTAPEMWYVDLDNQAAPWDGLTWETAFRTIQEGVDSAYSVGGGEVWVAEGTYTGVADPVVAMRENVDMYGGFIGIGPGGGETSREQRDWRSHVSAIDGQGARRCVLGADYATLDGFTVTAGFADIGAGMYNHSVSPTVVNCIFTGNTTDSVEGWGGGGIANVDSSPIISDGVFSDNSAGWGGGGIHNVGSSPEVSRCVFANNVTTFEGGGGGGGICYADTSSGTVTNCTFQANSGDNGGGIYITAESVPELINCTFTENSFRSNGGGAICINQTVAPLVTNCIFWGDEPVEISPGYTVTYSLVQGGYPGTGNRNADPRFVNQAAGDLRLRTGSPCIDSGTTGPDEDIAGISRPQRAGWDMGAHEFVTAVLSVVRRSPNPTRGTSVGYTVTFNEAVTGVDKTDFTLTTTGVSGAYVYSVSGTGATRTVTVATGTGSGTIRLDVIDNDTILSGGNPLGGVGVGNGDYWMGETYTVDKTRPTVSLWSLVPSKTNASPIPVVVTFSEPVTEFVATDITVVNATVSNFDGSGAAYTFDLVPGHDGTVSARLLAGVAKDAAGNVNLASNTLTRTYDGTPPAVLSIVRTSPNPTRATSVLYRVTFSEVVTGVDTTDFALTTTGVSGAYLYSLSGTGTVYTVRIATGTGSGTIRLDVVDDDSIKDGATNPLGGAGAGNGNFTTGEVYTVDKTRPTVSMSSTAPNPTNVSPIPVTVTFSEPVTGFVATDIVLTNATVSNFAGSGANYSLNLVPLAAGTVRADIPAGRAQDAVGNTNTAAPSFSRTYQP